MSASAQAHQQKVQSISQRHIVVDEAFNVRQNYNDSTIAALADDIAKEGLINALTVWDRGGDLFLVAGFRRMRAIRWLIEQKRLPPDYQIPCLVKRFASVALAMVANLRYDEDREAVRTSDIAKRISLLKETDEFASLSEKDFAARLGIPPLVLRQIVKVQEALHPDILVEWQNAPSKEWEIPISTLVQWSRLEHADQLKAREKWTPAESVAAKDAARRLRFLKMRRETEGSKLRLLPRSMVMKLIRAFRVRQEGGKELTPKEELIFQTLLMVAKERPMAAFFSEHLTFRVTAILKNNKKKESSDG